MLEHYKISAQYSVKEAIQRMDDYGIPVVFIVTEENVLEGIFTLGDMRQFILKNGALSACITEAMNAHPIVFSSVEEVDEVRKTKKMLVYPIIDRQKKLVHAIFEREPQSYHKTHVNNALKDIPLVIMAGGQGTRLYPYTKVLPKALIPIGDLTITERIINNFAKYGCREVYLILNYKSSMIKAYFNELKKDYDIHYIDEDKFLGTGGGLELLKGMIKGTFILSNCDILINDDIECIYKTHINKKNKITFVCAIKNLPISYGIVQSDENGRIVDLKEKPEFSFLTNTGVYVIDPEVLERIKPDEYIDFPDIAKRCIESGDQVGVFPVPEQAWLDMGKISEMENMAERLKLKGEF